MAKKKYSPHRVLQQHGVGEALCLTEPRDKSSCREFASSHPLFIFPHFILQLVYLYILSVDQARIDYMLQNLFWDEGFALVEL